MSEDLLFINLAANRYTEHITRPHHPLIPMLGSFAWEQERVNETVKRLKLNEHLPLAEARRKVWQQVDRLIDDFTKAKARCTTGNNPAAKAKLTEVRARVRAMTSTTAELSAVARWCATIHSFLGWVR